MTTIGMQYEVKPGKEEEFDSETTEQIPRTLLTLAVAQAEAERVLFGAKNGELAFALLTEKSAVKSGPGVTAENIFR